MTKQNVSFSKISKYSQCPRSYKHYYIDKLREKSASVFLVLGSAIDESLNSILKDFQKNKKVTVDYKSIFDQNWQTITLHRGTRKEATYSLIDCTLVGYAKADFVPELLQEQDLLLISEKTKELASRLEGVPVDEKVKDLEAKKSQRRYKHFKTEEHELLNTIYYLSLRRKAHVMLDAYVRDIIPQFEEVKEIQKKITIESERGHTLTGFIDAVVKFKGDDQYTVLDNKTSSQAYDEDKVKTSQQLAIYAQAEGLEQASYAVMIKALKLNKEKTCTKCGFQTESRHETCNNKVAGKRCNGEFIETVKPEGKTQVLKDKISSRVSEVVFENIKDVIDAINNQSFPQNLQVCDNIYGQRCPFYNKCWNNDSSDLEDLK